MPKHLTTDRLRWDILHRPGAQIREINDAVHQQARDSVVLIAEEYQLARSALMTVSEHFDILGLIPVYESKLEKHSGLEIGYVRWRYGRYRMNTSRRKTGNHPVTNRVTKSARSSIHYTRNDFKTVPGWHNAPSWEQELVMEAEHMLRPIRDALRSHEDGQRAYLFALQLPSVVPEFQTSL